MATFSRRKRATEPNTNLSSGPKVAEDLDAAALEDKENAVAASGTQHADSSAAADPFKNTTGKRLQAKRATAQELLMKQPVDAESGNKGSKGSGKLAEQLALMLPKGEGYITLLLLLPCNIVFLCSCPAAAVNQCEQSQLLCELPAHLARLDGNSGWAAEALVERAHACRPSKQTHLACRSTWSHWPVRKRGSGGPGPHGYAPLPRPARLSLSSKATASCRHYVHWELV